MTLDCHAEDTSCVIIILHDQSHSFKFNLVALKGNVCKVLIYRVYSPSFIETYTLIFTYYQIRQEIQAIPLSLTASRAKHVAAVLAIRTTWFPTSPRRIMTRQWSVVNPVELLVGLSDITKPHTPS